MIYDACAYARGPFAGIGGWCGTANNFSLDLSLSGSLVGELDQLRLFTHVNLLAFCRVLVSSNFTQ